MSSALQTIAEHLATDFKDAVVEAEAEDVRVIETVIKEFNIAWTDYSNRDATLATQAETALRTLKEIRDLQDVNFTTYNRRIEALRNQLSEFRETKVAAKAEDAGNVVRLENKG